MRYRPDGTIELSQLGFDRREHNFDLAQTGQVVDAIEQVVFAGRHICFHPAMVNPTVEPNRDAKRLDLADRLLTDPHNLLDRALTRDKSPALRLGLRGRGGTRARKPRNGKNGEQHCDQ